MDDEVNAVVMPDELKDMKVWVLCRDCHKVNAYVNVVIIIVEC